MEVTPAYIVADAAGNWIHATDAAYNLLATDESALDRFRLDDLSPLGAPVTFREIADEATSEQGRWRTGETEVARADGTVISVRFGAISRPGAPLVVRLEPVPDPTEAPPVAADALRAWRRQRRRLLRVSGETLEELLAATEADWLRLEYQRLFTEGRGQPRRTRLRRQFGLGRISFPPAP